MDFRHFYLRQTVKLKVLVLALLYGKKRTLREKRGICTSTVNETFALP